MSTVYVLHTGGTIGMERGPNGWRTSKENLEREVERIRREVPNLPAFHLEHTDRLFDSSQINPSDWNIFGLKIREQLSKYAGVVVLHGTDTMAYTASALAFMFDGLDRPIVLTGAQRPLVLPDSDGRANFVGALAVAARGTPAEVSVAFGGRLLRGVRCTKASATRDTAFESPNFPSIPLPTADALPARDAVHATPLAPSLARLHQAADPLVAALRFFPGISERVLSAVLSQRTPKLRGLVLEMFGTGNGPTHAAFLDVLRQAAREEIAVVAVSQCHHGGVNWQYEAGTPYREARVIPGNDIMTEAAVAKLTVLASRYNYADLVKAMARAEHGEMTLPDEEQARRMD